MKGQRIKLWTDPKQARGAGSVNTTPFQDYDPDNKTRLLILPGKKPGKAIITSRHTSPRIRWPKPVNQISEWITKVENFLKPYSSYHIYTDGSYKKQPWIRRHLPGRQRPKSSRHNNSGNKHQHRTAFRGLERQTPLTIAMHAYMPHGTTGDSSGPITSSTHTNTN